MAEKNRDMMMEFNETFLPGCYEIQPNVFIDKRGRFVKTFHQEIFAEHGLHTEYAEAFYSVSKRHVLRGLHFQVPPYEQAKVVYCLVGKILDAVVDLRNGSPTYGRHVTLELSANQANMVYIPVGMAHGFYTLSDTALMVYNVTSVYSPEHDTGILWNSGGIRWPDNEPIVSDKDAKLLPLANFRSPFRYRGESHDG
jgi:dTDP-4-dehydrorhamnose 3,5-epimerase